MTYNVFGGTLNLTQSKQTDRSNDIVNYMHQQKLPSNLAASTRKYVHFVSVVTPIT